MPNAGSCGYNRVFFSPADRSGSCFLSEARPRRPRQRGRARAPARQARRRGRPAPHGVADGRHGRRIRLKRAPSYPRGLPGRVMRAGPPHPEENHYHPHRFLPPTLTSKLTSHHDHAPRKLAVHPPPRPGRRPEPIWPVAINLIVLFRSSDLHPGVERSKSEVLTSGLRH